MTRVDGDDGCGQPTLLHVRRGRYLFSLRASQAVVYTIGVTSC